MDADVTHAERARLLDQADAGVFVVQEKATTVWAPLSVALPRGDAPGLGQFVHALKITVLIGVGAAMQKQAVAAV